MPEQKKYKGFKELIRDMIPALDVSTLKSGDIVLVIGLTARNSEEDKMSRDWDAWGNRAVGIKFKIVRVRTSHNKPYFVGFPLPDQAYNRSSEALYSAWVELVSRAEDGDN